MNHCCGPPVVCLFPVHAPASANYDNSGIKSPLVLLPPPLLSGLPQTCIWVMIIHIMQDGSRKLCDMLYIP